jgi:predicted GNAT family acetyltransferase
VTAANAAAFADVIAAAYEPLDLPPQITRKSFARPGRWASHWRVRLVLAGGEPVAGAMLMFSHGVAGVYWVGTIPAARGKGYADALVRSLSNHAFDRGATTVALQASPQGEPIYRRMGYREVTRHRWYHVPRAGEGTGA